MRKLNFPLTDLLVLLYGVYGERMMRTLHVVIVSHKQAFVTIAFIAVGMAILYISHKRQK